MLGRQAEGGRVAIGPRVNGDRREGTFAVYHAAVSRIYPNMPITAAILWTETASLMPLPDAQLHEALRRLSVP